MRQGDGERRSRFAKRIVRVASGLAIAATLLLVAGFAYASYAAYGGTVGTVLGDAPKPGSVSGNIASGTANGTGLSGNTENAGNNTGKSGGATNSPAGATSAKNVQLVALGDSLTHGLGDASGQGYVGDVTSKLKKAGYTVIQSNLGIDGLTSSGLLTEVKKPSTQDLLKSATLILISIGGNDLSQAAGLPDINTKKIAKADAQFQSNLKSVLTTIRTVNQGATILVVGLYNPYGDVASSRSQTERAVETWNADEQRAVASFSNTLVVQTYDLFELNPQKYLYIDHFHPNQAGYQRIADRVWQDVEAALSS